MAHSGYKDFWNPLEHIRWSNGQPDTHTLKAPQIDNAPIIAVPDEPFKFTFAAPIEADLSQVFGHTVLGTQRPTIAVALVERYRYTANVRYRKHGERRGVIRHKRVVEYRKRLIWANVADKE